MQIFVYSAESACSRILDIIPIRKVRKFARYARRYIEAYTRDLDGKTAIYAVKKYKSHRRLPASLEME
ncbi:hypothetical protein LIPSTDRAFT_73695 [Lipomyces starkeyi NRRL Y-11557]|uniref:Uncharacterized protein n=1 Tax=Lipomyces starkeyi NRRL Y-11557 TaxID=675824 RepID=A0A1E3Q085_LIPST|nr:hypothetical protein LIPSTDRAFT_73695 [Lipomyces starkeyi NRRL Y-11557]